MRKIMKVLIDGNIRIMINDRINKKLEDIELLLDAKHAYLGVREEDNNEKTIPQIKEYINKIRGLIA